ncbi:organic cation transporter protein-like [Dermacentor andersoni]|uniref:organic cation transporter protein-like n=1 Tax=Dermacentor andersoni TaxID=34620 RepID=UPI002155BD26|nr:organic cation transporter protein-like [Dermacentor andersoni]XP_054920943.1 organic cation transporter protein-like [Dermacentor andersoni]
MVGTDDVFKKFGPWHYSVMAFCFLRGFPAAYHAMAPTFTAPHLKHWCARPSQLANWSTQRWLEEGVPWEERKDSLQPSQCEMYAYEEAPDGSLKIFNDSRVKCSTWEYDLGDQTYTLTNTFDLVCDRVWLRAASQSIYMAGIMIGNTVFSHLSDWYGRRQSLVFMMPLPIVAGLLTTFAPSFWLYNIGRLISSIGIGGIQNTTFTIAMEVLSTRHRALGMLVAGGGWTTGLVTLTGIAWLIRDWQHLQIVISLVYFGNFFIWLFMPESPLWLLATKHYKKAEIILKRAITRNKVTDVDVNEIIKSYEEKMERERSLKKPTFAALFRYRCIRRTSIILSFKSIFSTLLYYNLTYTSILLGTNPYLSFFVMACMEYPQKFIAIVFINCMKRRTAYVFLYVSAALCSLVVIFVPSDIWWLQLLFMLMTKLFNSCAGSVNFVQISELYPTQVRTLATGWTVTTSRVGAIVAPFTKELAVIIGPWAPKAVDCVVCVLSVLLALMLPETFKMTLPDTVDDVKRRSIKNDTEMKAIDLDKLNEEFLCMKTTEEEESVERVSADGERRP